MLIHIHLAHFSRVGRPVESRLNNVSSIIKFVSILSLLLVSSWQQTWAEESGDFDDFSIEDLMNVEVISVSKKAQKLSDSPAAVFVITREDVRVESELLAIIGRS